MKTALLTTDTIHHNYFAHQVAQEFPWQAIFLETAHWSAKFETAHEFEKRRDEYEEKEWLADLPGGIREVGDTYSFAAMNDERCVAKLKDLAPEVVVVFGTGLLKPPIIGVATRACLNLHGGHPEEYRGLDSHLWAIYHNDFDNLVTTLHHVDPELDTGDIVLQEQLGITSGMELHELRAVNTRVCVEMVVMTLRSLEDHDWLPGRRQVKRGRYYSFMPSPLKEICVQKFKRHTEEL